MEHSVYTVMFCQTMYAFSEILNPVSCLALNWGTEAEHATKGPEPWTPPITNSAEQNVSGVNVVTSFTRTLPWTLAWSQVFRMVSYKYSDYALIFCAFFITSMRGACPAHLMVLVVCSLFNDVFQWPRLQRRIKFWYMNDGLERM
jgi:hypothetical protein